MDSYVFQTLKHVWRAYSSPERFFLVLASMLALASITGLAIVFVLAKTVTVPAQGGNYIEAVVGQPTGVNPVLANGDPEKFLVSLVFSPLGDIAKKIKPSSDLKEWDVRLKDNLYWQDGVPLTADDIIFTVSKIQDPMSRSPYASSWQGVTSERISSREIRFTLRAPYSFFNYTIDKLYPIPRHLFAGVPSGNWTLSEYNFRPVGNGHYRFLGYDTRNDGFITSYRLQQFSSRSSLAFIPDVTLRFYPSKKRSAKCVK